MLCWHGQRGECQQKLGETTGGLPGLVGAQDRGARSSGTAGRVDAARGVWPAAAAVGSSAGPGGDARVRAGVATPRGLSARPRQRRYPGRPALGRDRVRRRQASGPVPPRTPAAPPRPGAVSASAGPARDDDRRGRLPGAVGGRSRGMAHSTLLLDAHLKALRLPTFLREYCQHRWYKSVERRFEKSPTRRHRMSLHRVCSSRRDDAGEGGLHGDSSIGEARCGYVRWSSGSRSGHASSWIGAGIGGWSAGRDSRDDQDGPASRPVTDEATWPPATPAYSPRPRLCDSDRPATSGPRA